jgi:glutaredoxin
MERYPESPAIGRRTRPTLERDPDHPNYLGPILIPLDDVVLFSQDGCERCERVRSLLRTRGIAWREVQVVDGSPALQCEQLVFTGHLYVPVLCAAGYAVVGFDEARITEVLDEHVARLERRRRSSIAEVS